MTNKFVYLVQHKSHDEDFKIIGIYSTEAHAKSAIARAALLPGFEDSQNGFSVDRYLLDEDHWAEGFARI